jgi:hypothetical protein
MSRLNQKQLFWNYKSYTILFIGMPGKLTNKDYISILNYYDLPIPKSKRLLQKQSEKIMSEKLCKCIKKLDPANESKSIGICTKTIFGRKGFVRGKFQCKKKQSVKFRLMQKNKNKTKKINNIR